MFAITTTTTTTTSTLRCFGNNMNTTRAYFLTLSKKHPKNGLCVRGFHLCTSDNRHTIRPKKKNYYHEFYCNRCSMGITQYNSNDNVMKTTTRCLSTTGTTTNSSILDLYNLHETPDTIDKLQDNQRLVAIGDVHGDFYQLQKSLILAELVDPQSPTVWIGNNAIVVQIGDVLDRGKQELKCWKYLCNLSHQAAAQGGHVILLWGNHEVWNTTGLFPWADPGSRYNYDVAKHNRNDMFHIYGFHKEFKHILEEYHHSSNQQDNPEQAWNWRKTRVLPNLILNKQDDDSGNNIQQPPPDQETIQNILLEMSSRWAALEPGGLLSKPLLSKLKVAVQIGKTVFVHAGFMKKHLVVASTMEKDEADQDNATNSTTTDHSQNSKNGIARLNQVVKDWILSSAYDTTLVNDSNSGDDDSDTDDNNTAEHHAFGEKRLHHVFDTMPSCLSDDEYSPIWMRDYSDPPNAVTEPQKRAQVKQMIDELFEELGGDEKVDRLVMGHTPQSCINSIMDGKLWRIDIGMSSHMYGTPPEVFEINSVLTNNDDDTDDATTSTASYKEEVFIIQSNGDKIPGDNRAIEDDTNYEDHHQNQS